MENGMIPKQSGMPGGNTDWQGNIQTGNGVMPVRSEMSGRDTAWQSIGNTEGSMTPNNSVRFVTSGMSETEQGGGMMFDGSSCQNLFMQSQQPDINMEVSGAEEIGEWEQKKGDDVLDSGSRINMDGDSAALQLQSQGNVLEMQERPDALLPTLGGQTALNAAMALGEKGQRPALPVPFRLLMQ